jgi:hypothetical protein
MINKNQRNEYTIGMLEIFENFVNNRETENDWLLYFEDDVRPINLDKSEDLTKLYNIPLDAELIRPYMGKNEICNLKSNDFIKDTLMSSLNSYYDSETRKFQGSKHERLGDDANQYNIYEFRDNMLVVVRRTVCVHDANQSESSDCAIYEWQNGRLVFIESFRTE